MSAIRNHHLSFEDMEVIREMSGGSDVELTPGQELPQVDIDTTVGELQNVINGLPRFLRNRFRIRVHGGGTTNSGLTIWHFFGAGRIDIVGVGERPSINGIVIRENVFTWLSIHNFHVRNMIQVNNTPGLIGLSGLVADIWAGTILNTGISVGETIVNLSSSTINNVSTDTTPDHILLGCNVGGRLSVSSTVTINGIPDRQQLAFGASHGGIIMVDDPTINNIPTTRRGIVVGAGAIITDQRFMSGVIRG